MKSSPENPFLFVFEGKIPALKNGKTWIPAEGDMKPQVFSNAEVKNWYAQHNSLMKAQYAAQVDLDPLPKPLRVYCRFELFAKNALSSLDVDNVYTTVQELLQPETKHEGILGLIDDDKFVIGYSTWTYPIVDVRGAYLWVWESGPDRNDIDDLVTFRMYRTESLQKRLKKKTLSLARFL